MLGPLQVSNYLSSPSFPHPALPQIRRQLPALLLCCAVFVLFVRLERATSGAEAGAGAGAGAGAEGQETEPEVVVRVQNLNK